MLARALLSTSQDSQAYFAARLDEIAHQDYTVIELKRAFLEHVIPDIRDGITRMSKDENALQIFAGRTLEVEPTGLKQDAGLYYRGGPDSPKGELEHKLLFHDHQIMPDRNTWIRIPGYAPFFAGGTQLNALGRILSSRLSQAFDTMHPPSLGSPERSLVSRFEHGRVLTRTLLYLKPHRPGLPNATLHFDRSALTFHWWSSKKGLVLIGKDGSIIHVPETDTSSVVVFPGVKFGLATGNPLEPGTLHGVQMNMPVDMPFENRYAIITFTHTWLSMEEYLALKANMPLFELMERKYDHLLRAA